MTTIEKDQCVIFCSNEDGGVAWKTFFFHVQVLTLVQRQGDFNYINFILQNKFNKWHFDDKETKSDHLLELNTLLTWDRGIVGTLIVAYSNRRQNKNKDESLARPLDPMWNVAI